MKRRVKKNWQSEEVSAKPKIQPNKRGRCNLEGVGFVLFFVKDISLEWVQHDTAHFQFASSHAYAVIKNKILVL